jgi:dimethylamine monooxygenase subunit A
LPIRQRQASSPLHNHYLLPTKMLVNSQSAHPQFPPTPEYVPYKSGQFRLAMGLLPLDLRNWIEPDERMGVELAEKERLLRERHGEVFAALPGAEAGSIEVLELLVDYLPTQFPTLFQRDGKFLRNRVTQQSWDLSQKVLRPLDLAGRLVQEDLCLMQENTETGLYHLVGASLCFPTRWRLADKIGNPLNLVHGPVPGYEEELASTMDRFFARLKVDKPVWRVNWGLIDDPTLFQPTGHGRKGLNPDITVENAGDKLWLRMERQTLRRLPRTQDILFTIRVHVRPLRELATQPERAAELAATIRTMPEPMQLYKSLPPFREAVLGWFDRVALSSHSENSSLAV